MSPSPAAGPLGVVTLVNNESQYARMVESLRRQAPEGTFRFIPVYADKMGWNAATGLNHGIAEASSEWVVCVHQDVIFPDGWYARFREAAAAMAPRVAVLGLVGHSVNGRYVGHIKDPHGHTRWLPLPSEVVTMDEHLLALRKGSGLLFDPENPGFHIYGTDICLAAREKGLKAVVIDAPIVHLSGGKIDLNFDRAALWLLGKWGRRYRGLIPSCSFLLGKPTPFNFIKWLSLKAAYRMSAGSRRAFCDCQAVSYSDLEA